MVSFYENKKAKTTTDFCKKFPKTIIALTKNRPLIYNVIIQIRGEEKG